MSLSERRPTNHLAGSVSPYLLQHVHNPVDWFPWCPEALERARAEDKPIFLSIGYSACHWCHVMERECFENEAIAERMNALFVCIKVDREERPDLDAVYMNAVQMLTGSGGWPLSVFLTPDLRPYFGGTYFPPKSQWGHPGFPDVLSHAARVYREHPEDVARVAEGLAAELQRLGSGPTDGPADLDPALIERSLTHYRDTFDAEWGGFGDAPKFPPTGALDLMLRRHARQPDADLLRQVTLTLDRMATGGMADQLGGGFHRYSVDREWLTPHFEKMLYDNALLASIYIDAFRVTGSPLYRRTAQGTLDYLLREMTDESGGFHSAQDADSEGVEGRYYVWTLDEIQAVLGDEDAALFAAYFGVTERGNFEGKNILTARIPPEAFAEQHAMSRDTWLARLNAMKQTMLAMRARRVPPAKDDKVLADWNGLTLSALARGFQVFEAPCYRDAADRAADFVLTAMRPQGGLRHAFRDGVAHIDAFLDDYAFVIQGLLDLYEATFEAQRVHQARELAEEMVAALWDDKAGGFYATRAGRPDLLARGKDAFDGATPSGNAIAAHALLRLARLTDDATLEDRAERTLRLFAGAAENHPAAFTRLLSAMDFRLAPESELVVAGAPDHPETSAMLRAVRQSYLPTTVVAAALSDAPAELPLLEGRTPVDGLPTAYLCENHTCGRPLTRADELAARLEKGPTNG